MIARGFGTAAVLMLLVLILFALARVLGSDARPIHKLKVTIKKLTSKGSGSIEFFGKKRQNQSKEANK